MKKSGCGQNSLRVWIHTKAVLCDGCGRLPQDLRQILRIFMECAVWVTEDFQWEPEWITETNVLWKENDILEALNCVFEIPCPLQ